MSMEDNIRTFRGMNIPLQVGLNFGRYINQRVNEAERGDRERTFLMISNKSKLSLAYVKRFEQVYRFSIASTANRRALQQYELFNPAYENVVRRPCNGRTNRRNISTRNDRICSLLRELLELMEAA